jgi:AcrR family transcriptional regulator
MPNVPTHRRSSTLGTPVASADTASPWVGPQDRTRLRDRKRAAVILAAARAFRDRGYHNTSLDEIAAGLGITKPTIYALFDGKEDLLFECFLAGVEQLRAAFREVETRGASGRDRLLSVAHRYAVAITGEFGWVMVRAESQDLSPAMSARIKRLKSEIDQGLRTLIRAGIADGSIAPCDPKMTAFALAGAMNWIAFWHRADDLPESANLDPATLAARLLQVFESGLLPR